jgi:hypothetical protein
MKKDFDAKTGCGIIVGAIALIVILMFVSPLFLMWGWNLGVLALFPALPVMEYWTAFFVSMFFGAIGSKFHGVNSSFNKD